MQKLRNKIFLTYLVMIVIALIVFSLGFSYMLFDNLRSSTTDIMEKAIQEIYATIQVEEKNSGSLPENLPHLIYEMVRFDPYTEVVLLDKNGEVVFPDDVKRYNTFFNQQFLEQTSFMEKVEINGDIQEINYENKSYLAYLGTLDHNNIPDIEYIAVGKSLKFLYSIAYSTMSLIAVGVLVVIISTTAYGLFMARKIARPIKELELYAIAIGQNEPYDFTPSTVALEINSLGSHMVKMEQQLKLVENKQKEYFSRASHEIKTPLMIIQGFGEGINRGLVKDTENAGKIILQQTSRLNHIVEQLLILSKLDNTPFNYQLSPIELKSFFDNIGDMFIEVIEKPLRFTINCPEEIVILGNEELLHQVIGNAISNSLRYAKSYIEISIGRNESYCLIELLDDGGGIDEECMDKVFDTFFKGEKGEIGLGMSIMKGATEAMDGSVRLENKDNGLLIQIRLPIV